MYCIHFYVPETHLELVKRALFNVGAGKIGQYSHCAWQTLGNGQFMPLASSNPFIGEQDEITKLPEYKVEMVCSKANIKKAIAALLEAHPYEEPAYMVFHSEVGQ